MRQVLNKNFLNVWHFLMQSSLSVPKLRPQLTQINQTEGSYFQLLCTVQEGSLPLFFQWLKNGHSIKANPDVSYKIENFDRYSTFTISEIDRNDSGNYTCIVHNSIGSDSQSTLLSIKGSNFVI
jgi:hypothetical protein